MPMSITHHRPLAGVMRNGRLVAAGLALAFTLGGCTADEGTGESDGTLVDPIRPTTVPPRSDTTSPGLSDDGTGEGTDDGVGGGSGTGAGTGSGPNVGVPDDTEGPLE
jgi:hypothetical protein